MLSDETQSLPDRFDRESLRERVTTLSASQQLELYIQQFESETSSECSKVLPSVIEDSQPDCSNDRDSTSTTTTTASVSMATASDNGSQPVACWLRDLTDRVQSVEAREPQPPSYLCMLEAHQLSQQLMQRLQLAAGRPRLLSAEDKAAIRSSLLRKQFGVEDGGNSGFEPLSGGRLTNLIDRARRDLL
uniref:Uncharacterized protein n=1 Tax=Macrostomum lignano TaxID=282301 RepID=A0A1I8GR52_9PLAT